MHQMWMPMQKNPEQALDNYIRSAEPWRYKTTGKHIKAAGLIFFDFSPEEI